eukprot:TRINITY_DN4367_c0_g1_i1.p1 TRINITY_DN4367_c0_g1~~TRINITY_DN4367_c0_g1_i1.p1  ORF type:complete len:676 (-),score=83.34 TRINITY_DN4367_c0_g1_i1:21-2048(-)
MRTPVLHFSFLLVLISNVYCATVSWSANYSSNWQDASAWSLGRVPSASDDVYISQFRVDLDTDVTVQSLVIASSGTLNVLARSPDGVHFTGNIINGGIVSLREDYDHTPQYPTILHINGNFTNQNGTCRCFLAGSNNVPGVDYAQIIASYMFLDGDFEYYTVFGFEPVQGTYRFLVANQTILGTFSSYTYLGQAVDPRISRCEACLSTCKDGTASIYTCTFCSTARCITRYCSNVTNWDCVATSITTAPTKAPSSGGKLHFNSLSTSTDSLTVVPADSPEAARPSSSSTPTPAPTTTCSNTNPDSFSLLISTATECETTCPTGWTGTNCDVPLCPSDCNSRGVCSKGTNPPSCSCETGWSGSACEIMDCPGAPDCNLNGDCANLGGTPQCLCKTGWHGIDCSLYSCPNDCSSHGDCVTVTGEPVCDCLMGWTQADCSQAQCPNDCSGHGRCEVVFNTPTCSCDAGYIGTDCSSIHFLVTPTVPGAPTTSVTSSPPSNPSGSLCSNNCNGHGKCINSTCYCESDWTGYTCSIGLCPTTTGVNCNSRGTCNTATSPHTCTCNQGWIGSSCSVGVCPSINDLVCSGNGICYTDGAAPYCACYSGWKGSECNEEDSSVKSTKTKKQYYPYVWPIVACVIVAIIIVIVVIVLLKKRADKHRTDFNLKAEEMARVQDASTN